MKKNELTGKQFGRLTVIEEAGRQRYKNAGYVTWRCSCSCGSTATIRSSHLISGATKSCGCLSREKLASKENTRNQRPKGEAYMRYVYGYYAKNAKIRGIEFGLSFATFCEITAAACYYCGAPPKEGGNKSRFGRPSVFNGTKIHSGIDRVNSALGYAIENCVPCCKQCNYAKRDKTVAQFWEWIQVIHSHMLSRGFLPA